METLRTPYLKVTYNGTDITEDVGLFLISLSYTDKVEGESDDLDIELEDTDGLWRGQWYPEKGAKIQATIGYEDAQLDCGTFEIDEIELSGPPDTVRIKCLAAGIAGALRTKRSDAHEKKTLRQIAEKVAGRNGLTVEGEIPDVRFDRVTQNRETDLGFLKRIGAEYGCLFSVRDKKLIFTTIYAIEDRPASTEIDRLDIAAYSVRDKATKTYKDAKVQYHDPKKKEVVQTEYKTSQEQNADGFAYSQIAAGDTKVIYTKAENKQQAEQKAKASLHKANSVQQEGTIEMEGNPFIIAGNNFTLTGLGKLSGSWHVSESKHTVSRGEGYKTSASIKRVKNGEEAKQASTKKQKARIDRKRTPAATSVQDKRIEQKTNQDGYSYTQIQ